MPRYPYSSLIGVLTGFACALVLFAKRPKPSPPDDAEALLQQATQEMKEAQAKNRERAVQAITAKNNLQVEVDRSQKTVDRLEGQIETARQEGDADKTRILLAERDRYQETLTRSQAALQAAVVTTEAVKTAMSREEQRIRAKTAQALAMKSQEKQAQIDFTIAKSRLAMTTTHATELFKRAQAKIHQVQARRDLMVQIQRTVETLEDAAEDAETRGDQSLNQRLLTQRDHLKEKALSPYLWSK